MAHHSLPPGQPRLMPGLAVLRRDATHLQVGMGARRVLLPDHPEVRRLLDVLTGPAATRPAPAPEPGSPAGRALARLAAAGLLVEGTALHRAREQHGATPVDRAAVAAAWCAAPAHAPQRWEARRQARVGLDVPPGDRAALERLLAAAGVRTGVATGGGPAAGSPVLVVREREPVREELDALQHADVPHLLVRPDLDAVVVGPFVLPGRTACVRCLDAHAADLDPRHPLLVEQLARETAGAPCDPTLWQVALGWAAHDVVRWLEGQQPSTWSSTVRLAPGLRSEVTAWRRHPGCGCGWADLRAAGSPAGHQQQAHQKSESSLPSIERRCSREQVSQ